MIVNNRTIPVAAPAVSASPAVKAPDVTSKDGNSLDESQPDIHCTISNTARQLSETGCAAQAKESNNDRGRQLMLNQLYGGREPVLISGALGMRHDNMARSSYEFLTRQDLELLSDVYSYAQDQGVDLTYVDLIADDIGDYRQHDDGRGMGNFNSGGSYNSQGWQLTVDFNERDAAIASSLRSGAAINSTRFDQGFLRYILDPGNGAMGRCGDLSLLEHLVTHFSAEANTAAPLDSRFSVYTPIDLSENYVLTASTEIRLPKFEPDIISENGVSRLTAKGRALGIQLEGGVDGQLPVEFVKVKAGFDLLREWSGGESVAPARSWLRLLWERFSQ